ncbi:peptidylprolyl isomerase [Aquimarina sp. ERC-38]|uniref:peptidylprolyl isomerase n=1 Tax=Aquimarina sp. ERC-38 TaxID=2949996 RepID=UPI0022475994|nr:peptidylprolyl isomerase [Aquimarina sp. ERC-38]UZO80406.1 peptidylprolyl isomerase [Aquimarina sp. ERC-38]
MRKLNLFLLAILAITFYNCDEQYPELEDGMYAEIKTNKGTAIAELYFQDTPMTVANFVSLAEGTNTMVDSTYKGKKYYDGIIFHRVIKDFMVQTGDPLGTGTGDPGYKFPDEIVDSLRHDSKGILSMANSGPATNGSQFFITLKETPWLDGKHTVFGEVIKGQEVIDSIGSVKVGTGDKPETEVKMETVTIIRKGKEAKNFDAKAEFDEKLAAIEEEDKKKEALAAEKGKEVAAKYEKLKENAEKLDSGLEIVFTKKGEGPKPKTGETVLINYQGYFTDGKIFDTNIESVATEMGVFDQRRKDHPMGYAPIPMPYSPDAQMIPGFKEGVQQMKVGDEVVLYIPSHLAYGERGAGPIPANADLIFELALVDIQKEEATPPTPESN